jgi:protein-S-isoprenylcysteine O-methyltransferase Ste14
MRIKYLQNAGLFLLAVVFSIGLMFAFTELPRMLDQLLQAKVATPHFDHAYDTLKTELFFSAYGIRIIGYVCLGLIILFIILGFTTRRSGWAWIGGIALFLPVFATFAHSMFYLAGLGLLNVIMFPFLDISLSLIDLGKVVLIPYWILMWIFGLFNWHAHNFLTYLFMVSGAFIFILGVFAWFQTRYKGLKVAKHWIYRYSRHPQYLGWIIWSYGLMLYGPTLNQMKKSWGWNGTLPWLLATLVIIGICLLEEVKMRERAGSEYDEYRNRTPFLFPIPKFLKSILKAPIRMVLHKDRPERRGEVGLIVGLYALIFMGLSLFWVDLGKKEETQEIVQSAYSKLRADSLVAEIQKSQSSRYRSINPYYELISMGNESYPILFKLMEDSTPDIRRLAIIAASDKNFPESIPFILQALDDPEFSVSRSAVRGLGDMGALEAEDSLLYLLDKPREGLYMDLVLQALSKIGSTRILPYLEKRLEDSVWHHRTSALHSMVRLDLETAKPFLYHALEDHDRRVRRDAVYIILESLPEDATPHLEKVLHDKYWGVRFYAKQAIRLIEEKSVDQE